MTRRSDGLSILLQRAPAAEADQSMLICSASSILTKAAHAIKTYARIMSSGSSC